MTFFLKDSLGGNSKTLMIANVTSSAREQSQTYSTLNFARRAKMIKNAAKINQDTSDSMDKLKLEVQNLKIDLKDIRGQHAMSVQENKRIEENRKLKEELYNELKSKKDLFQQTDIPDQESSSTREST